MGEAKGEAKGRTEGRTEGRIAQAVAMLISILEAKYGRIPADLESTIRATSELGKLEAWVPQAATSATLDEFRKATGL